MQTVRTQSRPRNPLRQECGVHSFEQSANAAPVPQRGRCAVRARNPCRRAQRTQACQRGRATTPGRAPACKLTPCVRPAVALSTPPGASILLPCRLEEILVKVRVDRVARGIKIAA